MNLSAVAGAAIGVGAYALGFASAATHLSLSDSAVTHRTWYGLVQATGGGASAVFRTLGNNTFEPNTLPTSGAVTTASTG